MCEIDVDQLFLFAEERIVHFPEFPLPSCGFGCGADHGFAAAGVNGQQRGTAVRDGADCACDGVRNVVEFEVEEDLEAALAEGLEQRQVMQ